MNLDVQFVIVLLGAEPVVGACHQLRKPDGVLARQQLFGLGSGSVKLLWVETELLQLLPDAGRHPFRDKNVRRHLDPRRRADVDVQVHGPDPIPSKLVYDALLKPSGHQGYHVEPQFPQHAER